MSRLKAFSLDIFLAILAVAITVLIVSSLVNIPAIRDAVLPNQVASTVEFSPEIEYPDASDVYQVEVRNGVGVQGVAEQMRSYLRSKGYDVVAVGNHVSFDVEQTIIVDRIGRHEIAEQVAASLGLPPERIQQDVRTEFHLDVSVILGKDYGIIPPFSAPSDTTISSDLDVIN
ncbi:MAG: LytR C-terminal domain-containing protein [Bacteroidetes bacterium]|nr:LytR C-terminal domain-containing protein [Bacteroidota bacterium]MCY4204227.1 LytR C-terminal domain-containing protein [Bacteroidota bacterium]